MNQISVSCLQIVSKFNFPFTMYLFFSLKSCFSIQLSWGSRCYIDCLETKTNKDLSMIHLHKACIIQFEWSEYQRIFQKIFQRRLPHLVQKNPRSINNKFKIFYEKRFQKIWKNAILSRDDFYYTTLIQISLKFSE